MFKLYFRINLHQFARHILKKLLYVVSSLCTYPYHAYTLILSPSFILSFYIGFESIIAFVCEYKYLFIVTILQCVVNPSIFNIFEAFLVFSIINNYNCMRSIKIGFCDISKPLLPSSIPNLKFNVFLIYKKGS